MSHPSTNNAESGPSRLSFRFSPTKPHARLSSTEEPLDTTPAQAGPEAESYPMTPIDNSGDVRPRHDHCDDDDQESSGLGGKVWDRDRDRDDGPFGVFVPDQGKRTEKEGIGVMMGHSKMASAPHVKHLPVPLRNALSAQPSRQPSMSPSATQAQIHDLRPPRSTCACLDGPTGRDPEGTTGQWLRELCVGLVLCQCCPCCKSDPKY